MSDKIGPYQENKTEHGPGAGRSYDENHRNNQAETMVAPYNRLENIHDTLLTKVGQCQETAIALRGKLSPIRASIPSPDNKMKEGPDYPGDMTDLARAMLDVMDKLSDLESLLNDLYAEVAI